MRRWRERHPDQHRAEGRERYARDPERKKAQVNASPRRAVVRWAMHLRRRARAALAGGSFSHAEWTALIAEQGGHCAYCGVRAPLEADHRVPLARGGANDIGNIIGACARCNRRKHTRTEAEFRALLRTSSIADDGVGGGRAGPPRS